MPKSQSFFLKILSSKTALFLEVGVVLFFSFNLGKEILKKQAIEKEMADLRADIGKLESRKSELSDLLTYTQTDSFVANEARSKFNMAVKDENLVVIPNIDSTSTPDVGSVAGTSTALASQTPAPPPKTNLEKWWQYFFDHGQLAKN